MPNESEELVNLPEKKKHFRHVSSDLIVFSRLGEFDPCPVDWVSLQPVRIRKTSNENRFRSR